MTSPTVCVSENLAITADGRLRLAPWSVPQLVLDVVAHSSADTTKLTAHETLPGVLLIDKLVQWKNSAPIPRQVRVEVTRRWRRWVTSNPNAVQFRDRWSSAITPAGQAAPIIPEEPITSGILNGQVGTAGDIGTNSVAEPNPGKFWQWWGTGSSEEWLGPVEPGETLRVWYRQYVWTPPPFSDNANKNSPGHEAEAGWARLSLWAFPDQGRLVVG